MTRVPAKLALVTISVFLIASCTPRHVARVAEPHDAGQVERVYIATERSVDKVAGYLGAPRESGMKHARLDISIPPVHETGQVEWPGAADAVDVTRHFAVVGQRSYDTEKSFLEALRKERGAGDETLVFVHGYNNTISESAYRLAQIRADFDPNMPSVLFAWQSAADPRGYAYDRDSVIFARDDLEALLNGLTNRDGDKVFLLAHSIGAYLTMEVLRQAALRGDGHLLSRISGVVLMSPDIDPDVFRNQAEAIGDLPQPFFIFISQQDRALTLSGFLTGRKPRLGIISNPEMLTGLDVTVIDFSELGEGIGLHHMVPVTSPAAIAVLRGMMDQAGVQGSDFNEYMVLETSP